LVYIIALAGTPRWYHTYRAWLMVHTDMYKTVHHAYMLQGINNK
jgi:hypothetical protein